MHEVIDESVHDIIRRLQPGAVINDRGFSENGDYSTPERDWYSDKINALTEFKTPTEACQAVGTESWGYRADENATAQIPDAEYAKHLCMGGNYLLNIARCRTERFAKKIPQF
jgi:alpha-L-fucosidase